MALDLNDLRYFLEVRNSGSLTRAAQVLGVTQPSMTSSMQRLEKHFGTKLLLRERTGVVLTVTGRALANDAVLALDVLDGAKRRLAGLEDSEEGAFTIGAHESLSAYFLPDFFRSFFVGHPGIQLSIHNASSADVERAVLDRSVEFGIVVNPSSHADLVVVKLFPDAVDFFVLAESLGKKRPSLAQALARIEAGPLVHAGRVSESQELVKQLERHNCVPARFLSCGDFELVKSIALAGVGVAVLPRRVAQYNQPGRLMRLHRDLPHFPDQISLVYRHDLHKTKAALTLKDALTAHGRALPAEPR